MSELSSIKAQIAEMQHTIEEMSELLRHIPIPSDQKSNRISLMSPCGDQQGNWGVLRHILLNCDSKWDGNASEGVTRWDELQSTELPHGICLRCDGFGVNESITDTGGTYTGDWGQLKLIPVEQSNGKKVVVSGWAW